MKYVVLLVDYPKGSKTWGEMDESEQAAYYEAHGAYDEAVKAHPSAQILAGEALSGADGATTMISGRPEAPEVTDGSYTESIEAVGGFYLMEVPDRDTLIELLGHLPPYVVELREVVDV